MIKCKKINAPSQQRDGAFSVMREEQHCDYLLLRQAKMHDLPLPAQISQ
jgi:hypothetical protein